MPRSPSRDLSDRYTGQRGYFRSPDAIRRWKYILATLALFGAVAWAVADVTRPSQARYAHTHGPLSNPHAAFDDDCAACHVPHSPSDLGISAIFNTRDRWHDFTCEKCHSGPAHHASANEKAKEFHNRCSNCHHDHLGRLNSLVRLADKDCTQCHTNLGEWHDASKSLTLKEGKPYQNSVTNFVTDHPDFRSLDVTQPGKQRTLTFNHAVHMNPGQTYTGKPGDKGAMTVEKLRNIGGESAVARYTNYKPGGNEKELVQLDCASCHQLDAGVGTDYDKVKNTLTKGDPTHSLLPPRGNGAYFLPLNYEAHCRSCHPLVANAGSNKTDDAQLVLPRFDLPHRRQPSEIRDILTAGYLKELLAGKGLPVKQRDEPGGVLEEPLKPPPADLYKRAQQLTDQAEKLHFGGRDGCNKCHIPDSKAAPGSPFRIQPVPDRTVWLTHAKFNHAAHRGATCASCHPGTGAKDISPNQAQVPESVQILGVDSCRACHSPERTQVKLPDGTEASGGGIRHNCTDCHNYHHGDLPLQGRGSKMRFPKEPRDIKDWLQGK